MKSFFLEQIDTEAFKSFIEFCENNEWSDIRVFIDSSWWSMTTTELFLREFKEKNLTLIAWNWIYSAWFDLFYRYTWKKMMTIYTKWMVHRPVINARVEINTDGSMVLLWEEEAIRISTVYNDYQHLLTEEEKHKYKLGIDIYLPFNRMREIFPDIEVIG
jgi:hypothetical protein